MEKTTLNNTIKDLENMRKAMNESVEKSEDVKNGKCTIEDEKREPGYILYNQIAEANIKILSMPATVEIFSKLSENLGEEMSRSLVELLAITMTQSAHQAIIFHDNLLKEEITKQFDNLVEYININHAEISAHTGAIKVFKAQLNEIQKKLQIDSFAKENGMTPQK